MRISDWSSDVCSSDLSTSGPNLLDAQAQCPVLTQIVGFEFQHDSIIPWRTLLARQPTVFKPLPTRASSPARSEEHTSELQSLMRISYAVFCLQKKSSRRHMREQSNTRLNHQHSRT